MLRVISYNIRYNNPADGENAWPHRKERVTDLLNHHAPDLIGLQEVRKEMLDEVIPRLPDFDWVGVGRDDGIDQGEFAPIFYRRDRFALDESGTFWLSATPDVVGSVGWDASMARIASWAELTDQTNGERLLHINTHFDHRGEVAQTESAHLLRFFLMERQQAYPAVVTGDFNFTESHLGYGALTSPNEPIPHLLDAHYASQSPHEGPDGTFNGTFSEPLQGKIDYIFVWNPEIYAKDKTQHPSIQVLRHAILTDNKAGRYPSDHLPVLAEVTLQPA